MTTISYLSFRYWIPPEWDEVFLDNVKNKTAVDKTAPDVAL